LAILRDGLSHSKKTTHIEEIRGEFLAIDTALSRIESGDLCLILIDRIDESLAHISMRTVGAEKRIDAGQEVGNPGNPCLKA
jgi:cyanophycin synthetase